VSVFRYIKYENATIKNEPNIKGLTIMDILKFLEKHEVMEYVPKADHVSKWGRLWLLTVSVQTDRILSCRSLVDICQAELTQHATFDRRSTSRCSKRDPFWNAMKSMLVLFFSHFFSSNPFVNQ
jgi:hypothetical protein